MHQSFNPRTHIGCDGRRQSASWHRPCFNPRTHIGCDSILYIIINVLFLFQSTHPHRVRPDFQHRAQEQHLFQSTHPHRVRPVNFIKSNNAMKFQSTHPHRVRQVPHGTSNPILLSFNPRTHIGCDRYFYTVNNGSSVSIHAPT